MSKTEENLQEAFAGESQARNKYTFFAAVARKEGYHYIAKLFEETADNERRHAKDLFARLGGLSDTAANLEEAIRMEDHEAETMYLEFAQTAREEGNTDAAKLFSHLAKIEGHHRDRYRRLLERVKCGTVYKREKPIKWKCSVCGYIHEGTEPPNECPSCKHPREHYEPANMETDL